MNFDGFWLAEYKEMLVGAGVVVLKKGRIYGGDGKYFFTGKYTQTGDTLEGEVKVVSHNGDPGAPF